MSTSPKSECEYSSSIFFSVVFWSLKFLLDLVATNNFTSLSVTLPCLSLPGTLLILIPNSLANFLTFGDAEAFAEKSLIIIFLVSLLFFNSFFFISFDNWFFVNSWTLVFLISFSLSISIILSPSDTLSPILTFKKVTVPVSYTHLTLPTKA